jgi:hypothetical protein
MCPMSDPRPDNLISPNELLYEIERARRALKHIVSALQRAATTIHYYEERLEVRTHEGLLIPESSDGIACRDETIKLQDERIAKLENARSSK